MSPLQMFVGNALTLDAKSIIDDCEEVARMSPRGIGGAYALMCFEKARGEILEAAALFHSEGNMEDCEQLMDLHEQVRAKETEIRDLGPPTDLLEAREQING